MFFRDLFFKKKNKKTKPVKEKKKTPARDHVDKKGFFSVQLSYVWFVY